MWFLYDLIIKFFGCAVCIAALFNKKARKWMQGRKDFSSKLTDFTTVQLSNCPTVVWFHCASLGEFEQGRPVIEAFREEHPDWKIIVTFFSPSGYEIRKNYPGADHIFYLPIDTPRNARNFIDLINPSLVIFVKYEYWFRYLDELYRRNIPVYFISAIFRDNQHFFRWYGGWALKQLKKITGFFVQDDASAQLLRRHGIDRVTVSGDTRFDRVAAIAENAKAYPEVGKFVSGSPVFLAGSTWPADEEMILHLIEEAGYRVKFIIAPHEVGRERVEALREKVIGRQSSVASRRIESGTMEQWNNGTILFSELNGENAAGAGVLIIDGIGYLSHLYRYATIAFIGGGFGVGIHNILEAATFGKPVIFGPNYHKFREAEELVEEGGAFPVENAQQLNNRTIELLTDPDFLKRSSEISATYVREKRGATAIILEKIGLEN